MTRCAQVLLSLMPLVALPAGCSGAPDSARFGVMTHFAHGWEPELAQAVARSGVGSVRDEIYWAEVEPEPGVFAFPERCDRMMALLARENLEPLVVLSFGNPAYDGGNTPHSDEGIAGFARYAAEIVRRYGSQVKAVEVWNEFNGEFVRGLPPGDRAAFYRRLLQAVHQAVKGERPDVLVVGGATAGVPLPYWEKLLAGGALDFMDVLSVHPYRYDEPPEGLELDIAELQALVAKFSPRSPKPIWVTEIGWNTRTARATGDVAIDDVVQAQYLARAYALLFSAGVERVYWYLFRDYNEARMGLVRDDRMGTPKPALAAMVTMISQLGDAEFVVREPAPDGVYSICFRRPSGEEVRVMWALQPLELTVSGVTGVTDLFGRSLGSSGVLQLGPSPLYVTGGVQGWPEASEIPLADSRQGFDRDQGRNGWSYGYVRGNDAAFIPLPAFGGDDWRAAWHGEMPFLSVTAKGQHPSVRDGVPVAAVRRWQSDRRGTVRVRGSFRAAGRGGDGVGVAVVVEGRDLLRKLLGGTEGAAIAEHFDFTVPVEPGTTIDFVVDPGPAANIDHDGAEVAVTITMMKGK